MSETRRRWERLAFYDHNGIAAHLEKMALQGWMVEQPGTRIWRYRRIEPRRLRFAVTYFPDALSIKKDPTADQEAMEELCRRDGWILAVRWAQMQIFYNEQENPNPIDTDPVTTVETIRRSMRKGEINPMGQSLALDLLLYAELLYQCWKTPVQFLASRFSLLLLLGWMLQAVKNLIELGLYHYWSRKAAQDAEEGILRPVYGAPALTGGLGLLGDILLLGAFLSSPTTRMVGLLAVGAVLVPVLAMMVYSRAMQKRNVPRQTMIKRGIALTLVLFAVTMGSTTWYIVKCGLPTGSTVVGSGQRYGRTVKIYADELPLRLEDLAETGETQWSAQAKRTSSPLISRTEYRQMELGDGKLQNLEYTVTDIKVPALVPFCREALLSARQDKDGFTDHYEPIDPAPWKAEAAYQVHFSDSVLNTYLLFRENRIVELRLYFEPDEAQTAVVADKLVARGG